MSAIEWLDPADGAALDLRGWSIVSPALYAPFVFANSRAEAVLAAESIRQASGTAAPLAHIRSQAFDRAGFSLISVTHGGGLPPEIEVEFVDPFARHDAQRSVVVPLSRMRVARWPRLAPAQ